METSEFQPAVEEVPEKKELAIIWRNVISNIESYAAKIGYEYSTDSKKAFTFPAGFSQENFPFLELKKFRLFFCTQHVQNYEKEPSNSTWCYHGEPKKVLAHKFKNPDAKTLIKLLKYDVPAIFNTLTEFGLKMCNSIDEAKALYESFQRFLSGERPHHYYQSYIDRLGASLASLEQYPQDEETAKRRDEILRLLEVFETLTPINEIGAKELTLDQIDYVLDDSRATIRTVETIETSEKEANS